MIKFLLAFRRQYERTSIILVQNTVQKKINKKKKHLVKQIKRFADSTKDHLVLSYSL